MKTKPTVSKTKEYWQLCSDCGKELYPNAKIEGAITISMGDCPRCGKKGVGLTPVRDFETGNRGAGWD